MKKDRLHDDHLRMTSLQLVGKATSASPSLLAASSQGAPFQAADIPCDEGDLSLNDASMDSKRSSSNSNHHHHHNDDDMSDAIPFDKLPGPDESRWRVHGAARRKQLLDEDQAKGGRTFQLKFETSVHRYFSVAHWALEQFHELYHAGKDLEEAYVMGHRIVSFLTECLPHHPGLPAAPDIRQCARAELLLLRECLEDVALQIDEETCNMFVDEFDPLFVVGDEDDDDDDDDESVHQNTQFSPSNPNQTPIMLNNSNTKKSYMVRFENWDDVPPDETDWQRKSVESPSGETWGTTGTGSVEHVDTSFMSTISLEYKTGSDDSSLSQQSIEQDAGIELDSSDDVYEKDCDSDEEDLRAAFPSLHRRYFHSYVRLDFLHQIANEEVLYETDSEAADSWAQTSEDNHPLTLSSSGGSPTCDPARIAFRDLMNRLPQQRIYQDIKSDQEYRQSERRKTRQVGTEQYIGEKIQRDDTTGDDESHGILDSRHEKLKETMIPLSASSSLEVPSDSPPAEVIHFSSSSSSLSSSISSLSRRDEFSAFQPYTHFSTPANTETSTTRKSLFENNFLEQDDWISFDASNSQIINFFTTRN
jgi:hypothetical protein